MKALILAAGKGTRVRPITQTIPKPMIPIINKPVMETLVDLLRANGVYEIMVNTSYLSREIEHYFRDGSRFGVEMAYSFEGHLQDDVLIDEPLGSAGAINKIQQHSGFFDETFVVLCGDAFIDIDLNQLLRKHRQKGAMATIALTNVAPEDVSSYGVVVTDNSGKILEFQEKPSTEEARSTTINTGIYIFEPEVLNYIPQNQVFDIGGELFPRLVAEGAPIYGFDLPMQWLDIGKLTDYHKVTQIALNGNIRNFRTPGRKVSPGVWCGLNVRGDLNKCNIIPPVYIGGSVTLEDGCTLVGPVMIGQGSVIESDAYIENSAVFEYTRIGSTVEVKNTMICGNYAVDASGHVLEFEKMGIDWAVSDARRSPESISQDQQQFLNMIDVWSETQQEESNYSTLSI